MTAPQTLPKSVMAAFGLSVLLAASPAPALDFFWNNLGGGNWDDPTNWTPDGLAFGIPQAGDVAYLTVSYFSPIPVSYNSPGDPALDGLYIDSNALLFQTDTPDGDLTTAFEIVGWDGRGIPQVGDIPPQGTHIQRGATTRVENQLVLGLETEGRGTYQLLETGALETGTTRVGQAGLGTFIQSGGSTTHQVENDLILGGVSTGIGTYELSGPLSVGGDSVIGFGGVGELQQSFAAGSHTVGSNLILGRFETGEGTYGLSTGELRVAGNSYIGWVGTGEFEQTVSTSLHTVGSDLVLGEAGTGQGTYRLIDGELRVGGDAFIGRLGTGVFEQTADTSLHTVGSRLFVGLGGRQFSEGTYRLRGGELSVGSELGDSSDPGVLVEEDVELIHGTFEQSGGLHSIGNLARAESQAWLEIDDGRYELSDGELVVYGGTKIAPDSGGSFLQTGGTHRIGVSRSGVGTILGDVAFGDLRLGDDAGSHGQYLMQAGDLRIDPALLEEAGTGFVGRVGGELRVGQNLRVDGTGGGTGEFIQSGGSVVAYRLGVRVGSHYQLSGDGTLRLKEELLVVGGGLREPDGGNALIEGLFSQQGGEHTARQISVREGGTYDLQSGVLATNFSSRLDSLSDGITNRGLFSFSGGGIVMKRGVLGAGDEFIETGRGLFENRSGGRLEVSGSGTRLMAGDLWNNDGGTITLTDTDLVVGGEFANLGSMGGDGAVLELDPSSIHFEGDVSNGAGGYFVADAGSSFQMGADFINNSELNILWDTDEAGLIFDGEDVIAHVFALAGSDLGATVDGYLDNFAFGSLALAEDDSLVLVDGNATPGAALYVRVLEEAFDLGAVTSPFNIYYDVTRAENDWLGAGSYALNGGGSLLPIPEPGTATLVCLGLAGLGYRRRRV